MAFEIFSLNAPLDVGGLSFSRAALARICVALLLPLTATACSEDTTPKGSESHDSRADDDDDDEATESDGQSGTGGKDAGGTRGRGSDAGATGGPTMRGDAGRLDAGTVSPGTGNGADASSGAPRGQKDSGAVGAGGCTRDSLKAIIDQYFEAMATHDPSALPVAPTLKFTENAMAIKLGEGVWKTAGEAKFKRSALDTERCGTVTEAVIDNQGMDTIFGLRLKLEAQSITEVETIVVSANGFFPTPAGIINSTGDAWEDLVPEEQRNTREELEAASKAYFTSFNDTSTMVPYNTPCDRLENGFQTTRGDCSNLGGAVGIRHPAQRYPVTDLEAGITAGFVLFAGADIDFHMFKVIDGKIRWINAVVGPAVRSSGWD